MNKLKILDQDEVSITDKGKTYSWWRGRVEVDGGVRYFSCPLPIEGDRLEHLARELARQGQK